MEKIFYGTKKIISILLIILTLSIVMQPVSNAAKNYSLYLTKNMKAGQKYTFTGIVALTFKSESAARKGNVFRLAKSLKRNTELEIDEVIGGEIIKTVDNRYIKLTQKNIKMFKYVKRDYRYEFSNTEYSLLEPVRLSDELLEIIESKGIYNSAQYQKAFKKGTVCKFDSERMAGYYIDVMQLFGIYDGYIESSDITVVESARKDNAKFEKKINSIEEIKKCVMYQYVLDPYAPVRGPVRVLVNGDQGKHWTVIVGYRGKAEEIDDFLFLDPMTGNLVKGGTGACKEFYNGKIDAREHFRWGLG